MYFKPCSNLIGFAFGFEFGNKMGKKFLFSLLARGRRQPSTGVLLPLRAALSSFPPRTAQFPRCSLRSGPARVASEQA